MISVHPATSLGSIGRQRSATEIHLSQNLGNGDMVLLGHLYLTRIESEGF